MRRSFKLALVTAFGCSLSAHAQPVSGLYIAGAGGANLKQNEVTLPSPGLGTTAGRFWRFDTGWAGNVSLGYGLGNGLRAEIEGDYARNQVSGVSGGPYPHRAGGYEQLYGGMVNVLYDFDLGRFGWRAPVYPFVGVGAGGQMVEHTGFNQSTAGFVFPNQGGGSQFSSGFAYQAMAGVSYPVPQIPNLSLTLEYRFLGLADPIPAFRTTAYAGSPPRAVAFGNTNYRNDLNHQILVGLRYAFTQPPAPAAAPPPAAAPAPIARSYLVFFDWDRADLTERARQIVRQAGQNAARLSYTRIEVDGYTDTSGTAAYNKALSLRRARAVAAELVRNGVSAGAISIQGFGETHLLVSTGPNVREPQNRRVEIVIR